MRTNTAKNLENTDFLVKYQRCLMSLILPIKSDRSSDNVGPKESKIAGLENSQLREMDEGEMFALTSLNLITK